VRRLGLPLLLSGEHARRRTAVEAFAGAARSAVAVPVELWDERFTSTIASSRCAGGRRERAPAAAAGAMRHARHERRQSRVDNAARSLAASWLDAHRESGPLMTSGSAADMAGGHGGAWQGAGARGRGRGGRRFTRASSSTCWAVRGAARGAQTCSSPGLHAHRETRTVFVRPGAKIDEIGSELVAQGLLRSPFAFSNPRPSHAHGPPAQAGQYTFHVGDSVPRS